MRHEEKNLSFKEIVLQLTEFKINFKFNYFNFNLKTCTTMSTTENYPKRIIFVSGYSYRSHDRVVKLESFLSNISSNYRGPKIMVNNDFFDDDVEEV